MFYCPNGVRDDYVLLYLIKPDLLLSLSEWRDGLGDDPIKFFIVCSSDQPDGRLATTPPTSHRNDCREGYHVFLILLRIPLNKTLIDFS